MQTSVSKATPQNATQTAATPATATPEHWGESFTMACEGSPLLGNPPPSWPKGWLGQARLQVGPVDDAYEREADAIADRVMGGGQLPAEQPLSAVQAGTPTLQRKCAAGCEEETVQRKPLPISSVSPQPQSKAQVGPPRPLPDGQSLHASTGQPLPQGLRVQMERAIGHDFSGVRVHAGATAAEWSGRLQARAFTLGHNIYFNQGEYQPGSRLGQHLLAHELVHTVQQRGLSGPVLAQRRFQLNQLTAPGQPSGITPVTTTDAQVFFIPGDATANTTNRKAMVIGGIHRGERSAGNLSREALHALIGTSVVGAAWRPFFHTLFIVANPIPASPGRDRTAGRRSTAVPDLNREFGSGYTSPNPTARLITEAVTEFDPERILSIHAISTRRKGGIFLDPIHGRGSHPATVAGDIAAYPQVDTPRSRRTSYTGDPRNADAIALTERMIRAAAPHDEDLDTFVPGNVPTPDADIDASARPRRRSRWDSTSAESLLPAVDVPASGTTAARRSAFNLVYPEQATTTVPSRGGTSLGTWASALGKAVVTIEVPTYEAPRTIWRAMLPAISTFLEATVTARTALPRMDVPPGLDRRCLTFANQSELDTRKGHWGTVIGTMAARDPELVLRWITGRDRPPAAVTNEARFQMNCMIAALRSAAGNPDNLITTASRGSGIESSYRSRSDQGSIWHEKFNFTRSEPFDRISVGVRARYGTTLLPANELKWDPRNERHRAVWGVAPRRRRSAVTLPPPLVALTADERQQEILQASAGPGVSRHHWGTDFDILDPAQNPQEWTGLGNFADEYTWLQRNASRYGFLQSFTAASEAAGGHIEERWHWSYFPAAQALLEFSRANRAALEAQLQAFWGAQPEFTFLRANWQRLLDSVNETPRF